MGFRDNILEEIGYYTDEYLIGLGNKGLFKRAMKDFEGLTKLEYILSENNIEFDIDNNKVVIKEGESSCTCISRTMCKHIILSKIYLREKQEEIFGVKVEVAKKEDITFDLLDNFDYEKLPVSKKNIYKKALRKIELNYSVEVNIGDIVDIYIDPNRIRFFPNKELSEANCSCKSKDLCSHKVEAIAFYRNYIGKEERLVEESIKYKKIELEEFLSLSKEIKSFVGQVLKVGLTHFNSIYLIEQLAIKSRNNNMPEFERSLKKLIRINNLFLDKSSRFDMDIYKKSLRNLYEDCLLLEKLIDEKDYSKVKNLLGTFRNEYVEMHTNTYIPLGVEGVEVNSRKMKKYYFESDKKIYTFTSFEGVDISWTGEVGEYHLSKNKIKLQGPRIDENNNISSTKETKAFVLEEFKPNYNNLSDYTSGGFEYLIDKVLEENFVVVLLKIDKWLEGEYDKFCQMKNIYLQKGDKVLAAHIKYYDRKKYMINTIEEIEQKDNGESILLTKVYIEKARIYFEPISIYTKGNEYNF